MLILSFLVSDKTKMSYGRGSGESVMWKTNCIKTVIL